MKRRRPEHDPGRPWALISGHGSGFSLIELLVVINIAAYLLWLTVPMVFSITSASRVSEAANGISSAVERARSEAVTRRTYVWLALQEENNDQLRGIRVGMVASGDGTTNTNSANLIPLAASQLLKGVGFDNAAVSILGIPGTNPVLVSDCSSGLNFSVGKRSFVQGRSMTFMPQGEVSTNAAPSLSDGFDPLLVIPIREAHGTNLFTGNDAAVVVDGSVGNPIIYRK